MAASDRGADAEAFSLGRRLKELRREKHLTLKETAARARLSRGYVSQVEANTANPSLSSLKALSTALGESIASIFVTPSPESDHILSAPPSADVVRRDHRKSIRWPGDTATENFLLTPDLQRRLEVLLTTMEPGSSSGERPYSHDGEEFGFVLSGSFEVIIGADEYQLDEGDSISFSSLLPHQTRVVGDVSATVIWVVTPPSF
jgi:transcriptional regulator with XRE-family HTH domain